MEDVTVVIPNYNGIEYIGACLSSLYAGSVLPRVLVVDNGSSDQSLSLVREQFPKAQVLALSENTGFCHAVNQGIRAAATEYVILLNNDTRVDPYFVERLLEAAGQGERIFSVAAKMLSMKEPERIDDAGDFYCALGWAFARGRGKSREAYQKKTRIFAACAGAALYKKSLLERTGFFDEHHFAYLEDVDLGYRAQLLGYENVYEPEAVVYHAGSAVSGSRHNAFKVRLSSRNSVYLAFKNMPLLQLLLNLPFLLVGFLVKGCFFAVKGLGGVYARGLMEGVKLCFSGKGRGKKVPLRRMRLKSCLWIQLQLWGNVFLRFFA